MTPTSFPLAWPPAFPRCKAPERGSFKTTLPNALKNVGDSLQRFANDSGKGLSNIVMSSNVTLGVARPADAGVAVWFTWDGLGLCIAVDRYATVEANLQAIHHIIEARRVELRHGTLALVRATFQGFLALPAPKGSHWTEVLSLPRDAKREDVRAAYKRLSSKYHPDKPGGSHEQMTTLNAAQDAALKECTA